MKQQEKFNFRLYFKTPEGVELLNIFENHRKAEHLSKAEVMRKTLREFQNKFPETDILDKMLAEVAHK